MEKAGCPTPPPPPLPEEPGSVMGGGDRAKCVNVRVKELIGTYILKVMAACQGILFMEGYLSYKVVQIIYFHMYIYVYKRPGQDIYIINKCYTGRYGVMHSMGTPFQTM
jgi:hypothetical protein